jgi:hypothetical protein
MRLKLLAQETISNVKGVIGLTLKGTVFRTIEKIVAILGRYGSGKLLECKRAKCRRKSGVMDLVSISDEARERNLPGGDEATYRSDLAGR